MPAVTCITVTQLVCDSVNPDPWEVAWTDKAGAFTHRHDSKRAAQRHVSGLLADLAPGLHKADVLTINYRS